MKNCDLLKKFYEEQKVLVDLVDNLVLDTLKKGSFSSNSIGGKHNNTEYMLVCGSGGVQLKIFEPNVFTFEYSMDFEYDRWDCCQFFGTDNSTGINFGKVADANKFWVQNKETTKVMTFPFQEEEYFQNLTVLELSSEDLYKFFIGIEKEHQCVLQLMAPNSEGVDKFCEVLNNVYDMKKICFNIEMLEYAFRKTSGL